MAGSNQRKEETGQTFAAAAGRPRGGRAGRIGDEDGRRHRAARHGQGQAARGKVIAVGDGKLLQGRQPQPAAGEGRRPRAVHLVRRRGVQDRRQEVLLMREDDILAVIE